MKKIGVYLVIGFILSNCSQSKYDYKTENVLLDCFYTQYKESGVDIKLTINRIEDVLVKHNILDDKSGRSYIKMIDKIKEDNELDINNPDLIQDINSIGYRPSSVSCSDLSVTNLLDSASLSQSKLKYLVAIFDSIQVKGNISPSIIAQEILEVFDAKDFENDYYRTIGLVMFSTLIKMNDCDNGLFRQLPPLEKEEAQPVFEPQNVFSILINNKDEMLANGRPANLSELKPMIKKFIMESSDKVTIDLPNRGKYMSSKGVVSIQSSNGTSYQFYLLVQNELLSAYNEIRNTYSIKIFELKFDQLSDEQKEIIKKIVPQRISEGNPSVHS
nr:hypothetical protein [uncultured Carboxylicivirga sp.]